MTPNDIRALSDTDLIETLDETKTELFNLRFQNVTGQLSNSSRIRDVKRDVARLATERRMREIEAAEALGATQSEEAV